AHAIRDRGPRDRLDSARAQDRLAGPGRFDAPAAHAARSARDVAAVPARGGRALKSGGVPMWSSLALAVAFVGPVAQEAGSPPPQPKREARRAAAAPPSPVVASDDSVVELADGTKLACTLHHPKTDPPWPVVLVRTPYGRSGSASLAAPMVQKGV